MQRLLVFSCLVAFALASYASDETICIDDAHAFPVYGADAHLDCWVPAKDDMGNPIPPHTICKRISQTASCDSNCSNVPDPDFEVGGTLFMWRCDSQLSHCAQWLEKGSGYDTKVQPPQLAGPGESGKKMKNSIPIKCLMRGVCGCKEKEINGLNKWVCLKGNDLNNGDLYQGIEGGAACTVPAPPAGGGGGGGGGGPDPDAGGGGGDPGDGGGDTGDGGDGDGDGGEDGGCDGGCYGDGCV